MADDDIKKDADLQRDKPNMDNGEVPSSDVEILLQIKETLSAQTNMLEGDISSEITGVKSILQGILEVNQEMLNTTVESLRLDKDEEQDRSIEDLKRAEREEELLKIFQSIKDSVNTSAEAAEGKRNLGITGFFGISMLLKRLPTAAFGIGILFASIGIGIGLGAAGLLLGAKAVEFTGSKIGDLDTDAIIKAGEAIGTIAGSLDTEAIKALGAVFLGSVALSLTPGGGFKITRATGVAAGMAGIGVGIGLFFAGFLFGAKALEGVEFIFGEADYSVYKRAVEGFNDVLGAMSPATIGTIGLLLAAETFKGTFTGSKLTMRNSSVARSLFSVGAGISGFFLGLTAGNVIIGLGDEDLTSMQRASQGLVKIIDPLVENENTFRTLSTLLGIGIFGTAGPILFKGVGRRLSLASSVGITGGMALAGVSIGAFFSGIAMGGALGPLFAGDGSKFGSLMVNIAAGLTALGGIPKSVMAVTGIFAAAGATTAALASTGAGAIPAVVTGAATVGATLGIGAAGAAIGMFFTGISIGGAFGALLNNGDAVKKLMTSTADGLTAFNVLDGANLFNVGIGLGALGVGLATLAGGKVFDAVTGGLVDMGSGIIGRAQDLFEFFGIGEGSDNRGRFQKVADELDPLVKIGPQLAQAGAGLKNFSLGFDALRDVGTSNLEENAALYGRVAKALLQDFKLDDEEKSALANLEQMGKIDQDLSFIAKVEVVGIQDAINQLESLEETFNQIAPRINFQALTPEGQGANVTTPTQINTGVSQNVTQQNNAPVIHIQPRPHTAGNSGPGN